ncbi:MAG TPA: DUF1345 domain-containing protein [Amnibacterium sp.]|jgi:uncharacterized membrane protein|uniref:DUF1345 domain-containing protein n=1 Tax=Amnibacterium sp. TaxID=1872496 RepID=UPI002F956750
MSRAQDHPDASTYDRRRSWLRLLVAFTAGAAATTATLLLGGDSFAFDVGWVVLCAVYLLWVWLKVGRMDADATSRHATRETPNRSMSDVLLVIAAVASLVAVIVVLSEAKNAQGAGKELLSLLGVLSVAMSWFLVHTLFTLRYAVLYYTGEDRGISFNQEQPPRYVDFAYFAFTIGMTFQVSDTDISDSVIRATALRHALVAYLFGAVVIASAVNLIANIAG